MRRRDLLAGGVGLGTLAAFPAWAQNHGHGLSPRVELQGPEITLTVGRQHMMIDGKPYHAIGINGSAPAPLIRLREGQRARITVVNTLDEETSIHWHGLLLPFQMDGVPGISFPGIPAGGRFTYEFPVVQAGTYWYHSHSGLQEQEGLYGPIVIDPAGADPVAADIEHVVMLSDHSALHPHAIFRRLKLQGGYFNYQKQTIGGLLAGRDQPLKERLRWGAMRMDPSDVSDVTGSTYRYLVNGRGPGDNWTGLFVAGQRVRLRIVNASAMTIFNLRIPGLAMTVVQADGQNVRPVTVDELQIAVAETYDVIVTPPEPRAYTLVAESWDRSGMARATLAPAMGMVAAVPALRPRPLATMKDMGMGGMDHGGGGGGACPPEHAAMGHCQPMGGAMPMDHGGMSHKMRDFANAPGLPRTPVVQTVAPMPVDRTGEPPQGRGDVGHRVLTYRDLVSLAPNPDRRTPSRALTIHLTGNMERYMWAFDGVKLNAVTAPIPFRLNERVRVTLVNDTMMAHPIHLHGHFFELVTGHGDHAPRKHTVNVAPGGKVSFDLTADAEGDWAFHCHLLYHMHAGMMQVVTVRPDAAKGDAA
ncbi:copper resistance system multicopper oxidase [Sphingomonas paucimobilis]|nr:MULTISPECIES: copper resistance system multicopper oxidase [Sphingomonas]MBQ1481602.1 copper resistance system multicopper oxidase [Sphingomonas sp.]MCM3680375.1 copper resistance system multicopper oxidase [Sphingomonas paucimobilis]QBE94166.1 copper resistance system multicopper oxidase [Sphingomonas paucimobilis]QPS18290.1 copper resistance system multicopper oxidase [Sphingomonas paucimobilis]QPT10570.1 copper resistance system multicopper oxidase [Sphingomonas paucimobilis]